MRLLSIILLLVSFSVLAESKTEKANVWPRISVWPTGVDVVVDNYSDRDVTCSGTIYMYKYSGRMQMEHFYSRVYARSNTYRRFFNYDMNDGIRNANHSITCY